MGLLLAIPSILAGGLQGGVSQGNVRPSILRMPRAPGRERSAIHIIEDDSKNSFAFFFFEFLVSSTKAELLLKGPPAVTCRAQVGNLALPNQAGSREKSTKGSKRSKRGM